MALNVLLVDDSVVMRKVITRALRQAALGVGEVLEASDGVEALAMLERSPKPDLVLCDWNMPNMNGIDFVIASRAKGYHMPMLMVTTEGGKERIQRALDAGANGFVTKPFTPEKLAETLAPVLLACRT
ncbi:MAG: response regulator [Acidobacteria bacterium]|nr:response regulator [Acidobacteriota bacterium]